jgi:hypothetical protein
MKFFLCPVLHTNGKMGKKYTSQELRCWRYNFTGRILLYLASPRYLSEDRDSNPAFIIIGLIDGMAK